MNNGKTSKKVCCKREKECFLSQISARDFICFFIRTFAALTIEEMSIPTIRTTEDGSHTLFASELGECYHSTHGAIQESQHIFIEAGLRSCPNPKIEIVELGFGTGLNALLSLIEAEKSGRNIRYTSLEAYPISQEMAATLNFCKILQTPQDLQDHFKSMHSCPWDKETAITPHFSLKKIRCDFREGIRLVGSFDLCFFDAFSPEKQPELWTEAIFSDLFHIANKAAQLTTYCAKGSVRRAMQAAGFEVERLPGPPGKREMLRARKSMHENT